MADMEQLAQVGTQNQEPTSAGSSGDTSAATEKLVPQSEVNKIAARVREETRNEAYHRAKQDAMAELQSKQQPYTSQPNPTMGGMEQVTPDSINRLVEQKINERDNSFRAHQILQEFDQKMRVGKDKYPDFESTVGQLNLVAAPQLVPMANSLDNAADVMYDIAKNPHKYAQLITLTHTSPELAKQEMRRLSDSIKANEAAKNAPTPNEPLSEPKHSNVVGTDNGSMKVRDLRRQPWLKA